MFYAGCVESPIKIEWFSIFEKVSEKFQKIEFLFRDENFVLYKKTLVRWSATEVTLKKVKNRKLKFKKNSNFEKFQIKYNFLFAQSLFLDSFNGGRCDKKPMSSLWILS